MFIQIEFDNEGKYDDITLYLNDITLYLNDFIFIQIPISTLIYIQINRCTGSEPFTHLTPHI